MAPISLDESGETFHRIVLVRTLYPPLNRTLREPCIQPSVSFVVRTIG